MAKFIGTIDEFLSYFSFGLCTNHVNRITKKYKKEVGKCEMCGSQNNLETAHVHGFERPILIARILQEFEKDGIVEVDFNVFREKFTEAHFPFEKKVKILCGKCHREYDKKENNTEEEKQPLMSSKDDTAAVAANSGDKLIIEYKPSDMQEFKDIILESKRGTLHYFFEDGTSQYKDWKAERLSEDSDIKHNVRSRTELRQDHWKKNQIKKVVVVAEL